MKSNQTWFGYKKISLRRHLLAGFAVSACLSCAGLTMAQMAPVKIIVPFGPGTGTDMVARLLADELHKDLGDTFVVENREGASGFLAATAVARAMPDGRTLMMTSTTAITSNPFLFKKLPYDPVKDFRPVANIVEVSMVLVVRRDSPLRSVDQLLKAVRANPMSAYGHGSGGAQVAGAGFAKRAGLSITAVPYKSSPQAISDLIGGQFDYMFLDSSAAVPYLRAGTLRALAVARGNRSPNLPDVPTLREAGMDFNSVGWIGLVAPAAVPDAQIEKLNSAINRILQKQAIRERLVNTGDILAMSIAEFSRYLEKQRVEWGQMIKDAGIEPQ
jgi:tripartite-type tricarboxylate transporter receptor subunit TctC